MKTPTMVVRIASGRRVLELTVDRASEAIVQMNWVGAKDVLVVAPFPISVSAVMRLAHAEAHALERMEAA
jgi:hypothetical protein